MAKDLVCGMEVDEKEATKVSYKGKNYFFCGPECKQEFKSNPEQFLCAECGKACDIKTSIYKIKHKGKSYCFCSKEHKEKFQLKNFGQVIY